MMLCGYNRGVHYFESSKKYYELNADYNNKGAKSIFVSLIVVLNKVNDTYNIHDLGSHTGVRFKLLFNYKKYGINELNYEPALFDTGDIKFVWVRQNYSTLINPSLKEEKYLKEYKINLDKFYGK